MIQSNNIKHKALSIKSVAVHLPSWSSMVTVAILALRAVLLIGSGESGSLSKLKENSSDSSTKISLVMLTLKHCLRDVLEKVRTTLAKLGSRKVQSVTSVVQGIKVERD